MKSLKCGGCGSVFSKPESVLFHSGQSGNGSEYWEQDEYIDVCPVCGHDYFYEVFFCDGCGKEFDEEDILDEDELCPECASKNT